MSIPTEKDLEFASVALPHLPAVARFARSLTRHEADAEDLVQDTFLMGYRNWAQFASGTECRAWLFTICRNRFRRVHARAQRELPTEDPGLEALSAASVLQDARRDGLEDLFERNEIVASILAEIEALPEPFRETALLVDIHEHSYADVAGILDVPVGTVRSRLFRARRLLQERLLAHARDLGLAQRFDAEGPRGRTR